MHIRQRREGEGGVGGRSGRRARVKRATVTRERGETQATKRTWPSEQSSSDAERPCKQGAQRLSVHSLFTGVIPAVA